MGKTSRLIRQLKREYKKLKKEQYLCSRCNQPLSIFIANECNWGTMHIEASMSCNLCHAYIIIKRKTGIENNRDIKQEKIDKYIDIINKEINDDVEP